MNLSVAVVHRLGEEDPSWLEHCCLQSHVKVAALTKASQYYMTKTNYNGTQSVKQQQLNQACKLMSLPLRNAMMHILTVPSWILSLNQTHQDGKKLV
jgi:hypothetical protein